MSIAQYEFACRCRHYEDEPAHEDGSYHRREDESTC